MQERHSESLWALRVTGHFFGLVTQLVVKAYPFSPLASMNGNIWASSFVLPLDRTKEVATVMKDLVDCSRYAPSDSTRTVAPPPAWKPSVNTSASYTSNPVGAEEA